jgi:hypothetical protein
MNNKSDEREYVLQAFQDVEMPDQSDEEDEEDHTEAGALGILLEMLTGLISSRH